AAEPRFDADILSRWYGGRGGRDAGGPKRGSIAGAVECDHFSREDWAAEKRMNIFRNEGGFSLIEVMVAILILGIALTGLVHGITTALSSSKESELQTVAALYAQGKIEE